MADLTHGRYFYPYDKSLVERARELRKNMTAAEKKLWYDFLRRLDIQVLRQRPIDHYIADFLIPKAKLVIELDGSQHFTEEGKEYDAVRDAVFEGYGLRVLRFSNRDVLGNFEGICEAIREAIFPLPSASPF